MTDRPFAGDLPLSFAQEQLWFLDQLTPGDTGYHVQLNYRVRGPLDITALRRSLTWLVGRHEVLRATFAAVDGAPVQRIDVVPTDIALTVLDRSGIGPDERVQVAQNEFVRVCGTPFDLAVGPLYRFTVIRFDDNDHAIGLGFHHIVVDGWSVAIVAGELATAYRSFLGGSAPDLPNPELTYLDFVLTQRHRSRVAGFDTELDFWKARLAGLPVLDLPSDRPRPLDTGLTGADLVLDHSSALHAELCALAERHGTSLFVVLTAAVAVVLSRYTGVHDIPLGVPMLGRTDPDLEEVVGMFINMVVLRVDLSGDPTFKKVLDRINDAALDLYDHQEVPFEQVVELVRPMREAGRNPLFQVSVQVLSAANSPSGFTLPGLTVEWLDPVTTKATFDLNINYFETPNGLRVHVSYPSDVFDRWRIEAFLRHVERVLRTAVGEPDQVINGMDLLTAAERDRMTGSSEVAYVIDASGNLAPRGVPGDLLLGGTPESIRARFGDDVTEVGEFVPDPFRGNGEVCRTGIRANWTEDWSLSVIRSPYAGTVEKSAAEIGLPAESTPTAREVAGIFETVLGLDECDLDANLFGLGGNSLHATRVVSRINKTFGVKASVRLLYGDNTVRVVAAAIDTLREARK